MAVIVIHKFKVVQVTENKGVDPAPVAVQYLLPLCLMDMEQPDLAMTLRPMDGYYMGYTCLTLEMAYVNARILARPTAPWLLSLVE